MIETLSTAEKIRETSHFKFNENIVTWTYPTFTYCLIYDKFLQIKPSRIDDLALLIDDLYNEFDQSRFDDFIKEDYYIQTK